MNNHKSHYRPTLILFAAGLGLNIALVWLTKLLGIPLYLDSIGTILVAALGGVLPGIAVGFLSNCITALLSVSPDPMTLYFGFLNVLIAATATWLSKRGLLRKFFGRTLAVILFAGIGGVLGSFMTWTLYGFSFGQSVSAPLANLFYNKLGLNMFPAQFAADICVDLVDKIVAVLAFSGIISLLPRKVIGRLPLGQLYLGEQEPPVPGQGTPDGTRPAHKERTFRVSSIRTKITLLIVCSTTVLSLIALTIGITTYRNKLIEQYSAMCEDAVAMMLPKLDGDRVETYLTEGEQAEGYAQMENELYDILNNARKIKYMYVYAIREDGCHVVFDLDTEELAGRVAGEVFDFDESFPYLPEALAGKEIPPFITDDTYGWLLTVYKPIYNSHNGVVAYAAADIDMQEIRTNLLSFAISIASLLFGVMVVTAALSLWYCDKKLLVPIGVLVEQARTIDFEASGNHLRDKKVVKTGDEIEEVFTAMCRTEDAIAEHVADLTRKNREISLMQRNIIYTLANMVENRDGSTGGHIKRTARYVQAIANQLMKVGDYAETVNEEYISNLYDSAPLHDIGKVKIPDAILNKPGKLTTEEFALMKTHTTEGANILRTSLSDIEDEAWLSMAISMAGSHHERWDGRGYPQGLSGNDIPLCARIMAVADVFDALISQRCYKAAFSIEKAVKIITEESDGQFDPRVVEAFTASEQVVREIVADVERESGSASKAGEA